MNAETKNEVTVSSSSVGCTLIKLGGSLFDLPDLAERLLQFLDENQFDCPVIIPGGGKFADEIRRLDEVHQFGDVLAHQLGVSSLRVSSQFVAALSEKFRLVVPAGLVLLEETDQAYPVVDVSAFVLKHCPLPSSWDVTSDSIAAWLAGLHPQSKLVLLKSVAIPEGLTFSEAAEMNYVDGEFPRLARTLCDVGWCNLRAEDRQLISWREPVSPVT